MPDRPAPGLYERLLTEELKQLLDGLGAGSVVVDQPHPADSHLAVAEHLRRVIEHALRALPEDERLTRQAQISNALVSWLRSQASHRVSDGDALVVPLGLLREVRDLSRGAAFSTGKRQPLVPLSAHDLLVNARGEPSVGVAIEREIDSADRIDLICAFIRWNGLRVVKDALETHCRSGRPLRVITTVYTGSTERRALDWLTSVGAKVRVSYDTRTTRLHAKAWYFERWSGYSTAFIGSSNLTHSAMLDGVEWNVRLAQAATPELLEKFKAAFAAYWADPDYEPYEPARDADRFDRAVSRESPADLPETVLFDLRPWPFQAEMLERLEVERKRHGRSRNLIVSATGTGKTLVAAFDYRRLNEGRRPSLLFVAHRREILKQSRTAFRAVLRDGTFGELLVDGQRPEQGRHVFASIQSLAQIDLDEIAPNAFDVVIVDEFHHAAAPTYERLLRHLQPSLLLGLTATPERTDGRSVLDWFDGRIAVELRLWDALERGLLCPFQYFGVHDGTDLSRVQWSRRGYDARELENVYTGDQARVSLIVEALRDKVADPLSMRALGFCVSIAHARFMAAQFVHRGIPAVHVSTDTSLPDREAALLDLRQGKLNVVFCVDLFNEGIDVPDIDTVLFLRPTESALVFLQQLGRGLRLADNKSCLTVLDFIGAANRKFRFDLRLRALVGGHRSDLIEQIEMGFPRLPSGCAIRLDRVASKVVLDNVRGSLGSSFRGLADELRAMVEARASPAGRPVDVGLADFLRDAALELDDVYKNSGWTWSRLRREAGLPTPPEGPDEARLERAIPRLLHLDDPQRLALYKRAVTSKLSDDELDPNTSRGRALMGLHFSVWGVEGGPTTLAESIDRLRRNEAIALELAELFDLFESEATHLSTPLDEQIGWAHQVPLAVHSRASLDEILAAFGRMTYERPNRLRQGVDFDPETSSDLFFVTLEKTEDHYSPSTMYRDYAISPELFHWESQSTTSVESKTGQRYLHHRARGTHVLLFVRHRRHEAGRTAPYTVLGAADYVSHERSRPIAITWRLRQPMPDDFFREAKVAAG